MGKSIKRNNKYFGYDDEGFGGLCEDHKHHLNEKRLKAALRAKNKHVLEALTEEDYY